MLFNSKSRSALASVVLILAASGCGGSSGETTSTSGAAGATSPSTVQTEATTSGAGNTGDTANTDSSGTGFDPSRNTYVNCLWASSTADIEVFQTDQAGNRTFNLAATFPHGRYYDCGLLDRHNFSPDFRYVAFQDEVTDGEVRVHAMVADLTTGSVRDVSAEREGSGFSASALAEGEPRFLADGRLAVASMSGTYEYRGFDLNDPTNESPVSAAELGFESWDAWLAWGRDMYLRRTNDGSKVITVGNFPNPSKTRVIKMGVNSGFAVTNENWEETSTTQIPMEFGVWVNDDQLIASYLDGLGIMQPESDRSLTPVLDFLPESDNYIYDVRLSPDGTKVYFFADGATAAGVYSVPANSGGPTEPTVENSFPADPRYPDAGETVLWFPPTA